MMLALTIHQPWAHARQVVGKRIAIHAGKKLDTEGWVSEISDHHPQTFWFVGPKGWVLSDVVALRTPVPCRGAQKLWPLPAPVEAQVLRVMEQVASREVAP